VLDYGLAFLDRVHEDLSQLKHYDLQGPAASAGHFFAQRFQEFLELETEPDVRQVVITF
jgi:hypothetical protein